MIPALCLCLLLVVIGMLVHARDLGRLEDRLKVLEDRP